MTDTEQPSQWAEAEIAAMFAMHGIRDVPSSLVRAFAEREAELVGKMQGELRVLQDSHDWMYREKERLENALKDIASRAHANLSTAALKSREAGHG